MEDLGINSDGTNPGTEYEEQEIQVPGRTLPAITDLNKNAPEHNVLNEDRDGYS